MGYLAQTTLKIDLSDLGDNNGIPFFVEIKNPKLLTFKEKIGLAKPTKIDDDTEKVLAMQYVCKSLIISWNLLDMGTGVPVDLASCNVFDGVPSEVVEKIMKSLTPQESQEVKN